MEGAVVCSGPGIRVGGKGYEVSLAREWHQGPCGGASRTVVQEGRTKLGSRLARGTQGLTDGSFFELGHVLS